MTLRRLISQTLPLSGETIRFSSYRVLHYLYRSRWRRALGIFTQSSYVVSYRAASFLSSSIENASPWAGNSR